ncbi:hypothetical protein HMPREF0044_0893 [Gleimia coleocanis DSM 15436]|uniref:Aminoglycoside phosphotransferase domain-containing protein n=1 Tax=Gleimia coleocanis DSM 15436 TaxID=525245 RepID=C0W015_9ACTO|nr:hypothetical protein [Gleimia coleocanis]EEH63874.1 hypothetical protein HMPREF0044_0893 [Gleimia coleocanis DSM 15436]
MFTDSTLVWELPEVPTPVNGSYAEAEYLRAVFSAMHLKGLDFSNAQVLSGEQTNTSVLVDNRVLLKVYRQLLPGMNPEVLVGEALATLDSVITPRTLGAIFVCQGEERFVTHLATEFVPDSVDAFKQFTTEVFSPASAATELGHVTSQMHADLRQAFGASQALTTVSLAQRFRGELAETIQMVPSIAKQSWYPDFLTHVETVLSALEEENLALPTQKVHGDFHLGQVLFAPHLSQPWLIIDFEGEPLRPIEQRMLPDSALRDVAGMLRSFAYAAAMHSASVDAALWEETARKSYLRGYCPRGLSSLEQQVLEILEIEKTCYECRYEASFRPDWLYVPLAGLQRFTKVS